MMRCLASLLLLGAVTPASARAPDARRHHLPERLIFGDQYIPLRFDHEAHVGKACLLYTSDAADEL